MLSSWMRLLKEPRKASPKKNITSCLGPQLIIGIVPTHGLSMRLARTRRCEHSCRGRNSHVGSLCICVLAATKAASRRLQPEHLQLAGKGVQPSGTIPGLEQEVSKAGQGYARPRRKSNGAEIKLIAGNNLTSTNQKMPAFVHATFITACNLQSDRPGA